MWLLFGLCSMAWVVGIMSAGLMEEALTCSPGYWAALSLSRGISGVCQSGSRGHWLHF